jgi:hypothetical protein
MKRIVGTIVALGAVLAFSTAAHAASITYSLGGTSTFNTASSLAPAPPGYFITPLGAGSNITINTDTNGDSVVGDVSITGGTLYVSGTTNLGAYGTFISSVTTFVSGGTGTLTGSNILWDANTSFTTDPSSTFGCTGAICGLLGITQGVVYPIAVYQAFVASQGVTPVNPAALGTWALTGSGFNATGIAIVGAAAAGPAQWYLFAGNGSVPEPGTLVLVALGLAGLSLRSRKA